MNALELKALFIDYLLNKAPVKTLIGNEWIFGTRRYQVDLMFICRNKITALEIKSDRDSLRRLEEQLENYRLVFDYVYILTGRKFAKKVLEMVPEDIGIFSLTDTGQIKKIRNAKKQNKTNKLELLYSINAQYLSTKMNISLSRNSSDDIRIKLSKRAVKTLKMMLLEYLHSRLLPGFQLFMSERGKVTHPEDVFLFSQSNQSVVGKRTE